MWACIQHAALSSKTLWVLTNVGSLVSKGILLSSTLLVLCF